MISRDKVTEIFCIIDEFCKFFEAENAEKLLITSDDRRRRRRSASMSDSEIMTILLLFHFGSFRNFKHYYFPYVKGVLRNNSPRQCRIIVSLNWKAAFYFNLCFS